MSQKRAYREKDSAFDMRCRIQHAELLPESNLYPRSMIVMLKLLGCREVQKVCKAQHSIARAIVTMSVHIVSIQVQYTCIAATRWRSLPASLHSCNIMYLFCHLCHQSAASHFVLSAAQQVQQHVCIKECTKFDWLDTTEYADNLDKCCKICLEPRFEERRTAAGRTVIVPRKVYYDLGVQHVLQHQFFTNST